MWPALYLQISWQENEQLYQQKRVNKYCSRQHFFQRIEIAHFVIAEAICCYMYVNLIAKLNNRLVTKLNTPIKCSGTSVWTASKSLQTDTLSTHTREKVLLEIVRPEPSVQCGSVQSWPWCSASGLVIADELVQDCRLGVKARWVPGSPTLSMGTLLSFFLALT